MLNRIIRFSLHNRLAILIAAVLITITGIYISQHMEVDVFPDLNAPTVVVMTEADGMAPEEVERIVTFPIETAVNGATDVRRVRSTSTTGFSIVQIEFDWGTDIYRARQIVNEKLVSVSESLPPNVGTPTLGPQSSILGEVMIVGLTSSIDSASHVAAVSPQQLRTIADWTIRPRLLSIGGVAQVSVMGGEEREYQVLIHPEKLRHHDVSIQDILDVVGDMNQNVSGGTLYEFGNEYLIRGVLATNDVDVLGQTVIKNIDGVPVLLSQVADVVVGNKSPKTGVASNNGCPAVLLTVTKQSNVSTEELTAQLDRAFDELQARMPEGINVDRQIFRQSRFIDASINNIREALFEGAFFVVIVLFIFLMNWRTTIISLITIPLSLLVSIITLHGLGLTINTMSIGGMAIAIGSLVDDAIVDVENVYKKAIRAHGLNHREWIDLIFSASREVRMPILNSTLIIVVSFLPLFFLSGMEGRMLVPLGIAFIVSLFASTCVALTLTPVLCSFLLYRGIETPDRKDPLLVAWLKQQYAKALEWTLGHRRPVLWVAAVVFILSLGVFATFGRSFLPPFNEGSLTISISTLPGISLEESDRIGLQAEHLLMEIDEIQTVARKTGRAELDEHAFGVNTSEIEAPFTLKDRSRDAFMADVRQRLSVLPGVSIEIGQPISHRIDAMLSGTQANIAIKVFGDDLNRLYRIANQIKGEISGIEGVTDLNVEQQVERPQLRIVPRRSIMAKYGVTPSQFADYVRVMLKGQRVSTVYEGNNAFDLTVRVDPEDRDCIEMIRSMMIDANGKKIPLEYIADVESTSGPNTINRENVQRRIVVSANVAGRDIRSTVNDIQERIASEVALPDDYHITYGGQFESEASASRTLMLVSCVSILLIFLLLYNQFKSMRQAAVVLINLPLALIGGIFAIALTGGVVSIPAIIGFISLFGIATRNGILLIDKYNEVFASAPSTSLAQSSPLLVSASQDRLTPILMTALTSALALVPLALGGDLPGNEIQSPMAKVMLGGLISSTLLNMFIVPLMYRIRKQNP